MLTGMRRVCWSCFACSVSGFVSVSSDLRSSGPASGKGSTWARRQSTSWSRTASRASSRRRCVVKPQTAKHDERSNGDGC
eukprot:872895-Rhodomonas_salina.7